MLANGYRKYFDTAIDSNQPICYKQDADWIWFPTEVLSKHQAAKHSMLQSFFRWRSIKARVTLFTLVVFLIAIWSVAFYASAVLREDMQRQLGEQQFSTVSLLAAQVNEELDNRLRALETVGATISPSLLKDAAALQARMEQRPIFLALFNAGVIALGPDGTAIADIPRSTGRTGLNYMDRDYIAAALKEGKSGIGRPIRGKKLPGPLITMAAPIKDASGSVVGALAGTTDLSRPSFLDKITGSKYGKSGGYIIADRKHRLIVTASEKSRAMEALPAPGVNPYIDRRMQGSDGYEVIVTARGVEMLTSAKGVPVANWSVVVSLPTEEAFAPIRAMRERMLLATTLLTLLAGILVWWTTWWMLRRQLSPIIAATRTMDTLSGSSQPPQPIPVTSKDEIGELIGGFNRLLGAVAQREEALKTSEQNLQLFIDHAPVALAMFDRDMRYISASRRWMHDYGLGEREIRGSCHYDVFPEIPAHWKEIHRRALAGEELGSEAERFDRADGSVQWIRWEVLPWRDRQGTVGGILIFSEDLSAVKRGEEARAQLEGQLRESQKMEALGTLAGGVAHDFNNALAAIVGNVELARQDVGPGHPALESLEEIGKAGRRAKDLVQQILAFGRRQQLERKPMSLALVVVETARLMRATLPAMTELRVDCAADTPAVLADAAQVKQMLLNLCANAAQAAQDQGRPGVVDIRLDTYELLPGKAQGELRPGRYARLTVSDNGPGMDEATRSHIFEPFFTTKPAGKGTGLGLSVVHGIVQVHDASIEVESSPGEGSTFRIFFPAVEVPVADAVVPAPAPEAGRVHGKGKHVLYLDDEEAIIFLMKRLLERQGYRFSGYTEPRKALEAVRADPGEFDIAVTDYYMPGMSGLEVAQALKEIRPDLPVVMASGYITEELRAKAPAAGIRELIYKPNSVEDLCEAVARFANAQGAHRDPA